MEKLTFESDHNGQVFVYNDAEIEMVKDVFGPSFEHCNQVFLDNRVDVEIEIVEDVFEHHFENCNQVDVDIEVVDEFDVGDEIDNQDIVYHEVHANIEIVDKFNAGDENDNPDSYDLGLEDVVLERQPSADPNDNPKYSEKIRKKLELLKKNKTAYYDATKDWDQDLFKEGQEVQLNYQEFNSKVNKGCFCQYNPFKIKEFAEDFTKFRKELKCTQEDVRRDLRKYINKPLTTLMISKFENLNLTGTRMVGIKMLLVFWMKVKEVGKNRENVLMSHQRKMLEDLEMEEEAVKIFDDEVMWPAMMEHNRIDSEEIPRAEATTMETDPPPIRYNFEDGKLTRVFDCAEVQERVVMNSGVREKLAHLKRLENIRKENEKYLKKSQMKRKMPEKNVGSLPPMFKSKSLKKRGRPVTNFNMKRLTMGQKSGRLVKHGKSEKTDGREKRETSIVKKIGRNPSIKRWRRKKEPVGSLQPLFKSGNHKRNNKMELEDREYNSKKIKDNESQSKHDGNGDNDANNEANEHKEEQLSEVDYFVKDMGEINPVIIDTEENMVRYIQEIKTEPMKEKNKEIYSKDFLDSLNFVITDPLPQMRESRVLSQQEEEYFHDMERLNKVNLIQPFEFLTAIPVEASFIQEYEVPVITGDYQEFMTMDGIAPNHLDIQPVKSEIEVVQSPKALEDMAPTVFVDVSPNINPTTSNGGNQPEIT